MNLDEEFPHIHTKKETVGFKIVIQNIVNDNFLQLGQKNCSVQSRDNAKTRVDYTVDNMLFIYLFSTNNC